MSTTTIKIGRNPTPTPEAQQVLDFWFGLEPMSWFRDGAIDDQIRDKFSDTVAQALDDKLDHWTESPYGTLALVLVLDQFPRNLYRKRPESFAGDTRARRLTTAAVDAGVDADFTPVQRIFLTLPWEHAEDLSLQDRVVAYSGKLADDAAADTPAKQQMQQFHKFAISHRDVIARYGRFPHRNAILGRQNTPEEDEYLAQPGSGF